MALKQCTWVAVMDNEKVSFLTKGSDGHLIDLQIDIANEPSFSSHGGRANLRRVHDRLGPQRHISEPRKDEKQYRHKQFIERVSDFLDNALTEKKYDRLILIAPDKTLGLLRKALSLNVKNVMAIEIKKDYVNLPPHKIQSYLEEIVFF